MAASNPAEPLDSATVILLREPEPGRCEVLLVERHAESRAFGGAHVFPGGRVDDADAAPALVAASVSLSPAEAAALLGADPQSGNALAFWVAAIRELFEETGVLLASREDQPLDLAAPGCRAQFDTHRQALLAEQRGFGEIVEHERLRLATGELQYFSRWITPINAPRRYDTRFFVARLPDGQEPEADQRETTATVWVTPAEALQRVAAGTFFLAPPTMRTLDDLGALGTCDRILKRARQRPFPTILPKVVDVGGRTAILYPDDAAYERAVPGESVSDNLPGKRDRLLMDEGNWRSIRSA